MRPVVRQPIPSNLCGHACVATICRVSLEEGLQIVKDSGGPRGLTGARHVRRALETRGFEMDREATSFLGEDYPDRETGRVSLEGLWLCRMRWSDTKKTHWVVVEDGTVLDPSCPDPGGLGLTQDELVGVLVRQTGAYLSSGYRVRPISDQQPAVSMEKELR